MKKLMAILLTLTLLAGCVGATAESETNFTGAANGMGGTVTVTLTVADGAITAATVDTSSETPGYGLEIGDTLARQIVDAQGGAIDGISGATITSNAVSAAAQSAMQEAGLVTAAAAAMTPGVYVGSAHGSKSQIKMAVEVSEDTILNVWNVENGDTAVFSKLAVETVAEQIVAEQSLAVDGISGATLSSQGAIAAAADALAQAGADVTSLYAAAPEVKAQGATEDYDIVIVGAGASGLSAAIAAMTDDELSFNKNDLHVLVVERNGFVGGDVGFSGGYVASPRGTALNEVTGITIDDLDSYVSTFKAAFPQAAEMMNENVFRRVIEYSPTVLNALMERGLYLSSSDAREGSMIGGMGMSYTVGITADMYTGIRSFDDGYLGTYGSPYLAESMERVARDAGIEIRLNTTADSLIVSDGVCTGITVTGPDSTYQINADKVILCTGYASTDADTVAQFYPEFEGAIRNNSAGNLAFAQKAVAALGGEVSRADSGVFLGYNGVLGFFGSEQSVIRATDTVWVDVHGQRFFDETGAHDPMTVLGLDDHHAYIIFDSTNASASYYDYLAEQNLAFRADTLEDLGTLAGINSAALAATIDRYNTDAATDGDTAFGVAKESMVPVTTAPYYAVRANVINLDTNLGVFVDDDMTVLMGQNGSRIENLYAAGGAAANNLPNQSLGFHIMSAFTSGAMAGDSARDALQGQSN